MSNAPSRASLRSHINFKLQSGSDLKLRMRLGPQYPQPTTPTFICFFMFVLF